MSYVKTFLDNTFAYLHSVFMVLYYI